MLTGIRFATCPRWLSGLLLFVVVAWMLWGMRDYVPQFAVWIRQKLNGGPPPRNIMNDLNWLLLAIVGYVLPGLWIADRHHGCGLGVHPEHLARSRRVWKHGRYWLWLLLLLSAGLYVPYRMVWWIPEVQTIRQQAWSMGDALPAGLPHCGHRIYCCGLDDGDLHGPRRSDRTLRELAS